MPTKVDFKDVFNRLVVGWIVNFGTLSAFAACGWFMPDRWVPFFGFAMLVIIWLYGNGNLMRHRHNCSLLNYYTIYIVFLCASTMLIINLTHTHWLSSNISHKGIAQHGPFITSLWVMSMAAVFYAIALFRRTKPAYCKACKAQGDISVRYAVESNVFHNEMISQLRTLFCLCVTEAIIGWLYYAFFYINVNINVPDTFFYYVIPLAIFCLSVVYLGTKYSGMRLEAIITPSEPDKESSTRVNYMIVRGDEMMLSEVARDESSKMGMWDTPAKATLPLTDCLSDDKARELFADLSGTDRFTLRNLFTTSTVDYNTIYYAVFLDAEDVELPKLEGEWLNLYEISTMMKAGLVSRSFAYAMHRVYTMTIAWKTYHADGKRIYPIKNYRPTFRLSDFKKWEVDYNDLQWLNVAKNNEDVPFYRLRKFWRTYISGADLLWKNPRS